MNTNRESDINTPLFDINTQLAYKKYLPISLLDLKWGFIINDLGYNRIPADSDYPTKGHPGRYMFSWDTGRVLEEYHFVLITEGEGFFESESAGKNIIHKGDGFILFPDEWHRYKPRAEIGWTEIWIGFSGKIAENILQEPFFSKKKPVIQKCATMLIKNLIESFFQVVREETFGYQRTASGICVQLLAELYNIQNGSLHNKRAENIISNAKYLMFQKIDKNIHFQSFCTNQGISYSKFRKDFKDITGFSPQQFFLLMKVEKAKELLKNTNLRSTQISNVLGFKTDHYFSRIFKQKVGMTPCEFRSKNKAKTQ